MCLQLAAAISRGAAWPDGTPAPKGRALVIEGEDPVDTVTVPRLIAAGADLDRVTLVDQGEDMLTAGDLEDAAAGIEDLRLIVLSPIRRLIHDNQATNTEIRRRLEPLIAWARKRRCGLIGIMHPLKGNDRQSADALAGSPAYTELSRSTHLATVDEDDPEPNIRLKRRQLMAVKTNIAPEGMRSRHGRLQRGRSGVVTIALKSGAPLLPVVFYGGEAIGRNVRRLRRTPFHIIVGEPFQVETGKGRLSSDRRQRIADEIMYQMAALLPPAYRGEYADLHAATTYYLRFGTIDVSNL